jgi:hypothetical protein
MVERLLRAVDRPKQSRYTTIMLKKNAPERRGVTYTVRFNKKEHNIVKKLSKRRGLGIAELVRSLLLIAAES